MISTNGEYNHDLVAATFRLRKKRPAKRDGYRFL